MDPVSSGMNLLPQDTTESEFQLADFWVNQAVEKVVAEYKGVREKNIKMVSVFSSCPEFLSADQIDCMIKKLKENLGGKSESVRIALQEFLLVRALRTRELIDPEKIGEIKNEGLKFEAAKVAAVKDGKGVSENIQNFNIQDEEMRFKIAMIVAVQNGKWISKNIHNFCIKDEERLYKIAMIAAAQDGQETSKYIENYGIKDPKKLFEIAALSAQQSGAGTSKYIVNYGIKDPDKLFKIAKIAADQDRYGKGMSKYIKNYEINDKERLYEIAMISARKNGMGTSRYIKNYGITDPKYLFNIAMISAQRDGLGTSEYIKNYGIKDPDELFKIAKISAEYGYGISKHIKNYNLQNEEWRYQIAKIVAAEDGKEVSKYIQMYNLQNEEWRYQIAKIAAAQDGKGVSKYIQKYNIQNEEWRFQIAKIAATQDGKEVSKSIQNYNILDEGKRFEIAMVVAVLKGKRISENFKNFNIQNEEWRYQIAKIAAAASGKTVSKNIKNYNLQNEEWRYKIAKIAAAQDGGGTSKLIEKYKIKDPEKLFKIAMTAAAQNGGGTSDLIQNYGITDPEELFKIAMTAAAQDGGGTSEFIENYGIKDPEKLFKIAKTAAAQNGGSTSYLIQNYGITDPEKLFEIAMTAAAQDGGGTSEFIENYGITDPEKLFKIAELSAQQDGVGTSEHINNYGIKDPRERIEIFYSAIAQSVESIKLINNYSIPNEIMPPIIQAVQAVFDGSTSDYQKFKQFLDKSSMSKELEISSILEEIFAQKNEVIKKKQTAWLIATLIQLRNLPKEQALWIEDKKFLREIFDLRKPSLRFGLSKLLPDLAAKGAARFENLQKEMTPFLANMILSSLEVEGVSHEAVQAMNSKLKGKTFKDNVKLSTVLTAFLQLKETSNLTPKEKANVLNRMAGEKDLFIQCVLLQGILGLKGENKLKEEQPLENVLHGLFVKSVGIKGLTNFADKYASTFAKFRRPESVMAYAGSLRSLPDSILLLRSYGIYIRSVLENTFTKTRYQTDNNPHLDKIKETHPSLFEKWMKGLTIPLDSVLSSQMPQIDFFKILEKKVLNEEHIDPDTVPYLKRFLENPGKKVEITKELGKELGGEIARKEKKVKDLLSLQSYCIKLASGENPKNSLQSLQAVVLTMKKGELPQNFLNDIEELLLLNASTEMKKEKRVYQDWKLVNSDDPCDLLLCGTEVDSCQSIDGKPKENQCLLSYLLDGKIRLLAIKNPSGKIIIRTMLRLLWDPEKSTPVLFQDVIYSSALQGETMAEFTEVLLKEGEKIAKELGVPYSRNDMPYRGSLHALGGPVPWEYADEGGGQQRNGVYTIDPPSGP